MWSKNCHVECEKNCHLECEKKKKNCHVECEKNCHVECEKKKKNCHVECEKFFSQQRAALVKTPNTYHHAQLLFLAHHDTQCFFRNTNHRLLNNVQLLSKRKTLIMTHIFFFAHHDPQMFFQEHKPRSCLLN